MPNRLNNWSYRDLINFLKHHGFAYEHAVPAEGSHEAWIKHPDVVVNVSIPKDAYSVSTLKIMIRQSGIDQDHWLEWANSGGRCCKKMTAAPIPAEAEPPSNPIQDEPG
jgi:predicted RNA binding protein YcfA (HicA-like mRNA interferase family)